MTKQALLLTEEISGLDTLIRRMTNSKELDAKVSSNPALITELSTFAAPVLELAFEHGDQAALREIHMALFILYEQAICPPGSIAAQNQFNPALLGLRNDIEQAWLRAELRRIPLGPNDIPRDTQGFISFLKYRTQTHPVMSLPLFEYLRTEADRDQLVRFFQSDYLLNTRFFDLIAIGLAGSRGEAKMEFMRNLWDEVGRGDANWVHTDLFQRVMTHAEAPLAEREAVDDMDWQGLAGFNLYNLMGISRRHHYRYVGNMAATEMLDPPLYSKLLEGCRRVGLYDETMLAFYVDHLTTDVAHGQGWLDNVITPYVTDDPAARYEIYSGLEMRLNTCRDYHEHVYQVLTSEQSRAPR
jgi:Iron-containing redox enzyme